MTRAAAVTILGRKSSAVRLDDAASNGQSHASSLGFCRKEWLVKLLDHSAGKARTRVTHDDENVSISITAGMNEKLPRIGGHSGHCFKRIDCEIEKDLQELHGCSSDLARIGIYFGCHVYISCIVIILLHTSEF